MSSLTTTPRQKADIALQARKKAMARQKESERRQVESLNRKHLSGIRVVQKNLVYVVGLNPKSREEDLLQTLRGDQYFGQYGKIIKIVVSKAKVNAGGNSSIGVYVTFARKEDAASCIAAVDGSQNGDRTLRYVRVPYIEEYNMLMSTELNMGRQSTALPTFAMRLATIASVCFFMNKAKMMTASVGKTFRPSTLYQPSVQQRGLRQVRRQPSPLQRRLNLNHPLNMHPRSLVRHHIQWHDKAAETNL